MLIDWKVGHVHLLGFFVRRRLGSNGPFGGYRPRLWLLFACWTDCVSSVSSVLTRHLGGIDHACGYCSLVGHIISEIVVIENHNCYLSQSVTIMIQVVSES